MRRFLFALAISLALLMAWASAANSRTDSDVTARKGHMAIGVTGGFMQPMGQLGRGVNMSSNIGESGLNLDWGLNGRAYADYFLTDRFAIGGFYGTGGQHMKDLTLQTGSGPRTFTKLVAGHTNMLGAYAKYFMPARGAWSPYGYAGAAHMDRKVTLSRDVLALDPGATVFELLDDRVGFVGGIGTDYAWSRVLSLGVVASYDYSGKLDHDFPWMGQQAVVHDWAFMTLHAVVSYRLGVGQ